MPTRFLYFIPVHNEADVLERTVSAVRQRLGRYPGSEIFLLENGSQDESLRMALGLQSQSDSVPVRVLSTPEAGMGRAFRLGWQTLPKLEASDCVVLTAADLPFAFSDLDYYLSLSGKPDIAIGSKAHALSTIESSVTRKTVSLIYRLLRKILIGMKTRDSQGTFFIRGDRASLLGRARAANYFFTTELVCYAERKGWEVLEIPVQLEPDYRRSKVKLFRNGYAMLTQLWSLNRLLKSPEFLNPEVS